VSRIANVKKLCLSGLGLALLVATPTSAGGDSRLRYERPRLGLSVTHATTWRPIRHRLTRCTNPIERIDLAGPGGALFMLQESLGRSATEGMRPRSKRFGVGGAPHPLACCSPTRRPGWLVIFKDEGRGFYAYLYPGSKGQRAELVAILNSLRVRPK
jgi:hypothetical protein